MIILNSSLANELFANGGLNPNFFGVTSTPGESKTVIVKPDPIKQTVTVTPPSVVQDGVTVNFPPYTTEVTLQPPSKEIVIPSVGGGLKNIYESVGVINPAGQIRLCALVRPNVIAAARHYNNAPFESYIGMHVAFGQGEIATITRVVLTHDDFECYQLDRNITSVQPAHIAPLEPNAYTNREIIVFGLADARRVVAAKTALKFAFGSGTGWVGTASNKTNQPLAVQKGDSGSPVFIVANGVVQYFGSLASINLTDLRVNMAPPHAAEIAAL